MAEERRLHLSHTFMSHSGGTKQYALFTIEDSSRGAAVGIQVWGATNEISGVKFVTGTAFQVEQAQAAKIREKEAVRKGERYTASVTSKLEYGAAQAFAALKARMLGIGSMSSTRKIDEIADEALMKLGLSFSAVVEEQKFEAKAKTKAERAEQGADYNGSWGAW